MRAQWNCYEELSLPNGRKQLHAHTAHLLPVLREALATDILMTISRFCDQVGNGANQHLVLQRFLLDHPHLRDELKNPMRELRARYEKYIQPIRDGWVAHNDSALARGSRQIAKLSPEVLGCCVKLCTDIVEALSFALSGVGLLESAASVRAELNWIETALRFADRDRRELKKTLEAVEVERGTRSP